MLNFVIFNQQSRISYIKSAECIVCRQGYAKLAVSTFLFNAGIYRGAPAIECIMRPTLKLLAPLRCGPGSWFTSRNNLFLQLWKLTAMYNSNRIRLNNGVKHNFTSSHILFYSRWSIYLDRSHMYFCVSTQ